MNKKQWCAVASSLVLAFCLCTEEGDTNPAGGGSGDSGSGTTDFTGKWEQLTFEQTNYDLEGNEIDNPYAREPFDAYMSFEDESFTIYMPTDTCISIDGPNTYTRSGDTITYMWLGVIEMSQQLELKDGHMFITIVAPIQDQTTGEVLSTMVTESEWKPYTGGTLPLSSWPTEACPSLF